MAKRSPFFIAVARTFLSGFFNFKKAKAIGGNRKPLKAIEGKYSSYTKNLVKCHSEEREATTFPDSDSYRGSGKNLII